MRYLFCSLDNFGFLFSSLGIAEALRRRGHEIAFVTDLKLAGVVERAGFQRIPRGEPDGSSFLVEISGHPMDTMRQVRHVERALERFPADVLVTQQLALGPYVVAERKALPVATVGMASYLWPHGPPPEEAEQREKLVRRYRGFYLAYALVREMLGMERRAHDIHESPLVGDLFLLRSVPELEGNVETLPPQVHFVGDCLWEPPGPPDAELDTWLAAARESGEPLLYVQPGRAFNKRAFWRSLVEALTGQPVRVVAAVGRMDREVEQVPENFFVRPHVSQGAILPHARAVVSNATTTSVLGALTHGLPLLLIPGGGGAEQPDITQRCVRVQAGLHLEDNEAEPARLLEMVRELLGREELRTAAARLQSTFQRAGGHERAAHLLEELGRRRAPVWREPPSATQTPARGET
ncbi:glycosyl transferase [Cystobacter fuscus]|uniref:Glycosyl transferase n=1 Tax=Cystobacter fuscus TaxID=43 RepID=A0A250IX17_9BACT|nr:nucleotide disphospho-sugar-binding domain-containing protein [Cystobacter fuscus]ATB35828.1 glycosyl transferase [Cystobacter fuscus]